MKNSLNPQENRMTAAIKVAQKLLKVPIGHTVELSSSLPVTPLGQRWPKGWRIGLLT